MDNAAPLPPCWPGAFTGPFARGGFKRVVAHASLHSHIRTSQGHRSEVSSFALLLQLFGPHTLSLSTLPPFTDTCPAASMTMSCRSQAWECLSISWLWFSWSPACVMVWCLHLEVIYNISFVYDESYVSCDFDLLVLTCFLFLTQTRWLTIAPSSLAIGRCVWLTAVSLYRRKNSFGNLLLVLSGNLLNANRL